MNWLDIVIIAVTAFVALAGWRMGGIHIAVITVGILVGLTLGSRYHDKISPAFDGLGSIGENGAELIGFLVILGLVLVAALVLSFFVRSFLKLFMLGWLDAVLGAVLGVLVSLAVGSAILSTIQDYPILGLRDTIRDSTLGSFLADKFDVVIRGIRLVPHDLGR